MPVVMVLCVVGVFTIGNQLYEVGIAIAFGILGYFMKKFDYPGAPLVLGSFSGPWRGQSQPGTSRLRERLVDPGTAADLLTFLILAAIAIVVRFTRRTESET